MLVPDSAMTLMSPVTLLTLMPTSVPETRCTRKVTRKNTADPIRAIKNRISGVLKLEAGPAGGRLCLAELEAIV